MIDDGTWEKEISEHTQIIALTTSVEELKSKLNERIALATIDDKKGDGDANKSNGRRGKHYRVRPFRLEYKGESIEKDGRKYYWCKGDHWHNGEKLNGMYCDHDTAGHAAWREKIDALKRKQGKLPGGEGNTNNNPPLSDTAARSDDNNKKLALSEKLRAALTTHTGLSTEAYNRIYEEACRDSGNV